MTSRLEHRIVIATLGRPVGITGVHAHTRSLQAGIAAAGIPCTVSSPFSGSRKWYPIFAVRRPFLRPINPSWSTRWYFHWHFLALRENLHRRLREQPATWVIAQCPFSARAASEAALKKNTRVAMTCHFKMSMAIEYLQNGELNDRATYRKIATLEDEALQAVDHVIYVSKWAQQAAESCRAVRPRASTIVHSGIEASTPAAALTRADLGLSQSDLILINAGTLDRVKNQAALVDLFAAILAKHPNARLLIAGEGPQRGEIERRVTEAGLRGKVKLLGARSDVPALMALSDLYVHYSTMESSSIALMEAARAGLPSAALPVGAIPELQARLEKSVALDTDIEASLKILEPLLSNAGLRAEWGRLAQRNFQKFFTTEAMTARFLKALGIPPGHNACTDADQNQLTLDLGV